MNEETLATTRRSLHGVAELLLAGPQFRRSGTIRLRVTPGGFGTVREPDLKVVGEELVAGSARFAAAGRSYAAVAEDAGIEASELRDVYTAGPGVRPDETIELDPAAASLIAHGFGLGDQALRRFAPAEEPVLWPEHFDLAITADEVSYGLSPGDGYLGEPYAYVGPHQPRHGAFWNLPFGASRPLRELADPDAIVRFFREGQRAAAIDSG